MQQYTFKDHFSLRSGDYAAHRPCYPEALADFLVRDTPGRALALDCGCGSGQLSVLLGDRFERVIATDASAQQIAYATPHPRVAYHHAPAETSPLTNASADLIVVAQAAHWFDLPSFYREVRRVARPGAICALVAYGIPEIDATIDPILLSFYHDVLGPYWPPERRHVEVGYSTLDFPFGETPAPPLRMTAEWKRDDLIGYVGTWSALKAFEREHGREPFGHFVAALRDQWEDPDDRRTIAWPLTLRAGRVDG